MDEGIEDKYICGQEISAEEKAGRRDPSFSNYLCSVLSFNGHTWVIIPPNAKNKNLKQHVMNPVIIFGFLRRLSALIAIFWYQYIARIFFLLRNDIFCDSFRLWLKTWTLQGFSPPKCKKMVHSLSVISLSKNDLFVGFKKDLFISSCHSTYFYIGSLVSVGIWAYCFPPVFQKYNLGVKGGGGEGGLCGPPYTIPAPKEREIRAPAAPFSCVSGSCVLHMWSERPSGAE